uniref:Putative secreted protein n=1 Tax=Psorophora albipes TaxID=869069 RepID=T1DFK3_9DIPT
MKRLMLLFQLSLPVGYSSLSCNRFLTVSYLGVTIVENNQAKYFMKPFAVVAICCGHSSYLLVGQLVCLDSCWTINVQGCVWLAVCSCIISLQAVQFKIFYMSHPICILKSLNIPKTDH